MVGTPSMLGEVSKGNVVPVLAVKVKSLNQLEVSSEHRAAPTLLLETFVKRLGAPRSSLDALEQKEISCPCQETKHESSIV